MNIISLVTALRASPLERACRRFSFGPGGFAGWHIRLLPGTDCIAITARVEPRLAKEVNAQPGDSCNLTGTYVMPPDLKEDEYLGFIRNSLQQVVLHELDEALLVDGKRLWDPHKEGL